MSSITMRTTNPFPYIFLPAYISNVLNTTANQTQPSSTLSNHSTITHYPIKISKPHPCHTPIYFTYTTAPKIPFNPTAQTLGAKPATQHRGHITQPPRTKKSECLVAPHD
jgi:hypothetical protein